MLTLMNWDPVFGENLFDEVPNTYLRNYGVIDCRTRDTQAVRANLVSSLVNKHSGEVVEVDRRQVGWGLRRVDPRSASAALRRLLH